MSEEINLWDIEKPVKDYIEVPDWIEQDISVNDIPAIVQGGCTSGAYMPACVYAEAMDTMRHHGDEVFEFLENTLGELPAVPEDDRRSWSSMACHYMTSAVDLWAGGIEEELRAAIEAEQEETEEEEDEEDGDDEPAGPDFLAGAPVQRLPPPDVSGGA